jgi:hypothetical protein
VSGAKTVEIRIVLPEERRSGLCEGRGGAIAEGDRCVPAVLDGGTL